MSLVPMANKAPAYAMRTVRNMHPFQSLNEIMTSNTPAPKLPPIKTSRKLSNLMDDEIKKQVRMWTPPTTPEIVTMENRLSKWQKQPKHVRATGWLGLPINWSVYPTPLRIRMLEEMRDHGPSLKNKEIREMWQRYIDASKMEESIGQTKKLDTTG